MLDSTCMVYNFINNAAFVEGTLNETKMRINNLTLLPKQNIDNSKHAPLDNFCLRYSLCYWFINENID